MPRAPDTSELWAGLGQARRAHPGQLLDCGWGSEERRRDQLSKRPAVGRRPGGRMLPVPKSWLLGAGRLADPRMAAVRKEGAGPRGPAALTWASPNEGDPGPCGSPAFRGTAPEHGTDHRVPTGPRCLPGTPAQSGGPRLTARTLPTQPRSHLGSKDLSPDTGSQRLLGPRAPPGPSSQCQVTLQHYNKAHRPLAALDQGRDSPRAAPPRQEPVLAASESQARGSDPRAAMAWDSQIPPRGPGRPCCLASTRSAPALFGSSLPASQRPWASAAGDRSSGLFSPRKRAKSRALSNTPLPTDAEASETTGLTSATFLGPRDTPGCVRRPQGPLGLWRPHRPFQALPATRPNVRVPCSRDGSRARSHGDVNSFGTTRTPGPRPGPAAESLLGQPLRVPIPGPGVRGRPRSPEASAHLSWWTTPREACQRGPHSDSRRQGWRSHGSRGPVLGRGSGR